MPRAFVSSAAPRSLGSASAQTETYAPGDVQPDRKRTEVHAFGRSGERAHRATGRRGALRDRGHRARIPAHNLPRLFERFWKERPAAAKERASASHRQGHRRGPWRSHLGRDEPGTAPRSTSRFRSRPSLVRDVAGLVTRAWWRHATPGAGYETHPIIDSRKGSQRCRLALASREYVTTGTPCASTWSVTMRRWQRHHTASAHMIAQVSCDAMSSNSRKPSRKAGVWA